VEGSIVKLNHSKKDYSRRTLSCVVLSLILPYTRSVSSGDTGVIGVGNPPAVTVDSDVAVEMADILLNH
jgi:hypothetical protein